MNTNVEQIPLTQIKPFISRARPRAPFERLKRSIRELGVKLPVQVRRLDKPEGRYRFERIVGEGRILACTQLGLSSVPAIVIDAPQAEVVGRFLSENVLRKNLPWHQKAELIRADAADVSLSALAKRYHITEEHAKKLLRIIERAAPTARDKFDELTVEEAEQLTSLPVNGQEIVIATMSEEKIDRRNLETLVKKAKSLAAEGKELSKSALKASLKTCGRRPFSCAGFTEGESGCMQRSGLRT